MQDYPNEPSWPFLDKLICAWREKEEEARAACGEPPAPPYGRCRIFTERNQQPTEEWLVEAGMDPTASPTKVPTPSPSKSPTKPPTPGPTSAPSPGPTFAPSPGPTSAPSPGPTSAPSPGPTSAPSPGPTKAPSAQPSPSPSSYPTGSPTGEPELEADQVDDETPMPVPTRYQRNPSRFRPTMPDPTPPPTGYPSIGPTSLPTTFPTKFPTKSPSSEPTPGPTHHPTKSPTDKPSRAPSLSPSKKPTSSPTEPPTPIPSTSPNLFGQQAASSPDVPPEIDCSNYEVPGGYGRMCHSTDPCCEKKRSDTAYCWGIYDNVFPGPAIESACHYCCPEENKQIGPDKDDHPDPDIEKTIQCSIYNTQRYCRPNNCCEKGRNASTYCKREYLKHTLDEWKQICVSQEILC